MRFNPFPSLTCRLSPFPHIWSAFIIQEVVVVPPFCFPNNILLIQWSPSQHALWAQNGYRKWKARKSIGFQGLNNFLATTNVIFFQTRKDALYLPIVFGLKTKKKYITYVKDLCAREYYSAEKRTQLQCLDSLPQCTQCKHTAKYKHQISSPFSPASADAGKRWSRRKVGFAYYTVYGRLLKTAGYRGMGEGEMEQFRYVGICGGTISKSAGERPWGASTASGFASQQVQRF